MAKSDYFIVINEVHDRKAFLAELLSFYASLDATFTIWGKLPFEVTDSLSSMQARTPWFRRVFFHELNWRLNNETVNALIDSLCADHLIDNLTWGASKGNTSLGLCRAWDDVVVDGSDLIEDATLLKWVEDLKSKEIIQSYEKTTD